MYAICGKCAPFMLQNKRQMKDLNFGKNGNKF